MGCFSVLWCLFMTIVLCLPQSTPINEGSMNYSPIALGGILVFSWTYWLVSARKWFRVNKTIKVLFCILLLQLLWFLFAILDL